MKNTLLTTAVMFSATLLNAQVVIKSAKVGQIVEKNVSATEWNSAQATTIALTPQMVTSPMLLDKPTVQNAIVKSINDGKNIAFLIEWADATKNVHVDVDKFSDQLAIQLPHNATTPPSFMMGNKGGRVHIINWKGVWQEDIEKGFRDVKDAHPNTWTDTYPMVEKLSDGTTGRTAMDITPSEIAKTDGKVFMAGAYAGNPMSIFDRKTPCEENIAEGFGTLTHQAVQNATAWGVWNNGVWKVMVVRPINSGDDADAPIPGKTKVAFAIWDGEAKNISGRKLYTMWIDLEVAQ